ncbi:MAG TPA: hypothetical protein PKE56_06890, partial [Acidimicrobiales bacterium]|nr:hypothetical protein [Acidimicrobiales bacterium]
SASGVSVAAQVFRDIAGRIATEIAPPVSPESVDMAGCSARMLEAAVAALDALDEETPAEAS